MKKIVLILAIVALFLLSMSFVSAKEDTHFDIDTQSYQYGVTFTLLDSNNNPIPHKHYNIEITKPNGAVRHLKNKVLDSKGQAQYFLGTNGDFIVTIEFRGNDQYNPTRISKLIKISKNGGASMYDYYTTHNYGDSVTMDDYMDYNFWSDEIYDDASSYDGEWY